MKSVKKLVLGIINLALIGVVGWYAWQAFGEYMDNPWTRDGQVRGHVIQVVPRVSGMVTRIAVIDNQFVHKGDLLFEIDPEAFEIAIAQVQASLKRATISSGASRIEYERLRAIYKKDAGAVSQKDLNLREAGYQQSLSQLTSSRKPYAMPG